MTKSISAAELMAQMQADPKYQKMQAETAAERSVISARLKAEETQLVNELKDAGWHVESVWDLVNTSKPYPEIIPLLLSHLKKPYSDRIREGIARALAVPDAISAWQTLRAEYEAALADSDVKNGLAAALAAASNKEVIDELVAITGNPKNGSIRILVLRGLRRSRSSAAVKALKELIKDPALSKEISSWKRADFK